MPEKLRDLIVAGEKRLRESGIENARLDAEILLAFIIGCGREKIFTHPEHEVQDQSAQDFHEIVERRARRCPLQYLMRKQEFYSLEFHIDERVLIPRPESELIIDEVLKLKRRGSALIADIGTGSGNLAVTIAVLMKDAKIYATDASSGALEVAAMNAEKHAVSDRISFLEGDFLEPLTKIFVHPTFDCIVSNPPYVSEPEIGTLQEEVKEHEPLQALVSGPDGLDSYRAIVPPSFDLLVEGGFLILEVASGRGENVKNILSQRPFNRICFKKDIRGIDRIAIAIK